MASAGLLNPFAPPFSPAAAPPTYQPSSTKTWKELNQAVRRARKASSTLCGRVPTNFTIRHVTAPDGSGTWTRLYFLCSLPGTHDNTLLHTDIPPQQENLQNPMMWNPLLEVVEDTFLKGTFSKEEQLLRERKRIGSYGITSYEFDEQTGRLLFPTTKSLFYCDDPVLQDNQLVNCVYPWHIENNSCSGSRNDAKMCPTNNSLISFVHKSDIWATHTKTGHTLRLTFSHKGDGSSMTNDPKSAGVPSFVVQEEFARYTGYWWQPQQHDSADMAADEQAGKSSRYLILYEEVDEEDVEIINISQPGDDGHTFDEYRYPRAGTTNAFCDLKLIELEVDEESGTVLNSVRKRMSVPLKSAFPWMEYILQAGWTPDGKRVYCTLLDRQQQKLAVVLIDVASFSIPYYENDQMEYYEEPVTPSESNTYPCIHLLYEDTSDVWVNAHHCLHFLPSANDGELCFLWASEKTGHRHLYKITVRLAHAHSMDEEEDFSYAALIEEVQLTSGDWSVSELKLRVDTYFQLVYFIGYKDSPLETHLYCVSYEQSDPQQQYSIDRLTELGYSHTVYMDTKCSMFVSVYSSVNQPPASKVFRIRRELNAEKCYLWTENVCTLLPPSAPSPEYYPPQLFSFPAPPGENDVLVANGPTEPTTLHGMYFAPHNLQPNTTYPTVLFVYGGPQVQLITNSYKAQRFVRLHILASFGYAVLIVDSRGSVNRGLHFESHIKHRLGMVEIRDQVAGLHYLASQVSFIDLERVAIHGWSYGGYLSLMGLVQRPDIFKLAIAGAPVTSWQLYDTGYTERYMDTPANNMDGYLNGSLLQYIDRFPDEENRLLIVHGLIDENVHFLHSRSLITALIKACKPYQLQVYPNERHGIRNSESGQHYETMVLSFLQKNL